MQRVLREPLLHFAALGALLFGAHTLLAPRERDASSEARAIEISDQRLDREAHARALRLGVAPEELDREALRREASREEALVREARALGLDTGDLVVRRRLVQKMELVLRAGLEVPDPDGAALDAYLEAHADRYRGSDRARASADARAEAEERALEEAIADVVRRYRVERGPAGGEP